MQSIGQHISRIKSNFKINTEDSRLSDRFVYLLMRKHRDFVVKRDKMQKVVAQDNLFQTIPYEELIEVDSVESCKISTDCVIKRTKNRLPDLLESDYGVIIRWVGSLDRMQDVKRIDSTAFARKRKKSSAKYSTEKYYWFSDGYLYLPDTEWDAIRLEGYFTTEILENCDDCGDTPTISCIARKDDFFRISDYLVSGMDEMIYRDLSMSMQIPQDHYVDKNENNKR
jgi:hypothetical protein